MYLIPSLIARQSVAEFQITNFKSRQFKPKLSTLTSNLISLSLIFSSVNQEEDQYLSKICRGRLNNGYEALRTVSDEQQELSE